MADLYIKDKLERAGLMQRQLADKIGVSEMAVSAWCNGKAAPTARKLPAVAAALGCKIEDLYREGVAEHDH